MIEAAGGVVWRTTARGRVEIVVIHRRRHGDWSLPKGKLEVGEAPVAGALREVEEETGLVCELGPELPSTRYLDRKRRHKRVRYWAMAPLSGLFVPNVEVDEIAWIRLDRAPTKLSFDRDVPIVAALGDVLVSIR